jgi:UDP-glucose 4-epimerase
MTKVLVTGAAGFIGSNLVDELIAQGYEVYGIDNLSTGKKENINRKCRFTDLDLRKKGKVASYVGRIKPEYVFHLAALARIQPSIKDPITWNDNNANSTLNLLNACRKAKVLKVVYSGSSSAYGDNSLPFVENQIAGPKNPYALSKYVGEQWCKLYHDLYGLDVTVLRYFNVYGPRQVLQGDYATVVGIFLNQKREGRPLTIVGDGTQRRDFTYVKDIVAANIAAAKRPGYGLYNIGTGRSYTIKTVADMIEPDQSKRVWGLVRQTEAQDVRADNSKAKEELGWEPKFDLASGIKDLLNAR